MKVIIIIPTHNEAENIESLINEINKCNPKTEYVIINDGSTDETSTICKNNGYNMLELHKNIGIGGCVQQGYQYALHNEYDIAIQLDGDGQHDPKYIPEIVAALTTGAADIVIGSRYLEKQGYQSTRARRIGIRFLSTLIKICGKTCILDVTSGYRGVNRRYIEYYAQEYSQDYPEPQALMAAILRNATILEIPVMMRERQAGESSIKGIKSILYMVKVTISILRQYFQHMSK